MGRAHLSLSLPAMVTSYIITGLWQNQEAEVGTIHRILFDFHWLYKHSFVWVYACVCIKFSAVLSHVWMFM